MKLSILGPAGSGKGQNTSLIARRYNLKHVVVGDIVKKEIREKTDVGKIMYDYTSVGKFVPTKLVMQVLSKQLAKLDGYEGYIIDTAPINMEQFEKMNIDELDAVMNYPFRDNMIDFLNGKIDAGELSERFYSLYENYPRDSFYSNFNLLGSHDSIRLYTALLGNIAHIKSAVYMQMCFPGVPVIYYGDELGYEGGKDPENRAAFDMQMCNDQIKDIYNQAIRIRKEDKVFIEGDFKPEALNHNVFCITRQMGSHKVLVVINRSGDEDYDFYVDGKNLHINRYETKVIKTIE